MTITITSAIVLFAVIWSVILFIVLPLWQTSQYDAGEIVPGTPASAPTDAMIKKKLLITTVAAVIVFSIVYGVIVTGAITLDDFTFFTPPSAR